MSSPFKPAQLTLQAVCGYPSWNPAVKGSFNDEDFKGRYIVKAVKKDEEALKRGYVMIGAPTPKRYDAKNADKLVGIACRWLAKRIDEACDGSLVLVPIPNSTITPEHDDDYLTANLAGRVAAEIGDRCKVYTGLRFRTPMVKSSRGGSRVKEELLTNMTLIEPLPAGELLLFDDVCSSGAHLFAGQRKLPRLRRPARAFTIGRTFNDPQPLMIKLAPENLTDTWWS